MTNQGTMMKRGNPQAGFTLIEALIALVVMAFGMLALAGMQVTLSRSSDVAKQRTEAVRLAQRRIDELRSFTSIAVSASHPISWDGMAGSTTTTTTNATYSIVTAFASTASAPMRPVSVTVSWTDRANEVQSVMLSSVIAKGDPVDIGLISNPLPLNQPLKRPKNRNINIPIPALDLGGGQSATQFNANYAIVYSNVTAGVVYICDPNQANATIAQINALLGTAACDQVNGYIVAGYMSRESTSIPWPTGVDTSALSRNTANAKATTCMYTDAVDQNNASIVLDQNFNDFGYQNGYKYYLCVVPLNTPFLYGGTLRFSGLRKTANDVLCRYQYTQADLDANEKNIQPYVNVNKSIDEQNYRLTSSAAGTCPANMTLATVSTGVVHQDCRSSNSANHPTVCP
jgi:type IV pilus modification protein PilV